MGSYNSLGSSSSGSSCGTFGFTQWCVSPTVPVGSCPDGDRNSPVSGRTVCSILPTGRCIPDPSKEPKDLRWSVGSTWILPGVSRTVTLLKLPDGIQVKRVSGSLQNTKQASRPVWFPSRVPSTENPRRSPCTREVVQVPRVKQLPLCQGEERVIVGLIVKKKNRCKDKINLNFCLWLDNMSVFFLY